MLQIAFTQSMVALMRFFRFLLPILALSLIAAANKPKQTIRFHTEANPVSGAEFTMSAQAPDSGRTICISKVASISEFDIAAVYPFPAANGNGMGCAFKLDEHGRIALDTLSQECHGTLLFGFYNGRAVTAMQIDRRVADGIIVIPQGILPKEIELLRKSFPVLGEHKGKKSAVQPKITPSSAPQALPTQSLPRGD